MIKQHGLYKYVTTDTNEIIYIGKTNTSFESRISAHDRCMGDNAKFRNYIGKTKVFIAELPNKADTDILEKILINQYKPILNSMDNYDGFSGLIKVQEPEWKEYIPKEHIYLRQEFLNREKLKSASDYLKIDLKPAGYNLDDYVNKRAAALTAERGRRVGKATYIQELIIADMESSKVKNTKREKVARFLENMDNKKLNALIALLN